MQENVATASNLPATASQPQPAAQTATTPEMPAGHSAEAVNNSIEPIEPASSIPEAAEQPEEIEDKGLSQL